MDNSNGIVLFLGDNLYPAGVKDPLENYPGLNNQINLISETDGDGYFVPGNHDWMQNKRKGYQRILNQDQYITDRASSYDINAELYPKLAGPGPVKLKLNDDWAIVFIDSQWFLHGNKVGPPNTDRDQVRASFWQELDSLLNMSENKNIILAAHHPVQSVGGHGAKKLPLRLLLQSVGQVVSTLMLRSITPYHLFSQDIRSASFQKKYKTPLIQSIEKFLNEGTERKLIYVAGHEHNLQYWVSSKPEYKNRFHLIVSGAGSKHSDYNIKLKDFYSEKDKVDLIYPASELNASYGYFYLDLDSDSYRIKVRNVDSGETKELFVGK